MTATGSTPDAAVDPASPPAAGPPPPPSETPRSSFHLLLATIFLPFFSTVIAWAFAAAFWLFWRRRAVGPEQRRWTRRIAALAVADALVAVAACAPLYAPVDPLDALLRAEGRRGAEAAHVSPPPGPSGEDAGKELAALWASTLAIAAVASGAWYVARRRPEPPPRMRWTSALALGAWYAVAGGARLGILLRAAVQVFGDGAPPAHPLASFVGGVAGGGATSILLLALPVVVFGPVGEELAFRGVLQPALARRWGAGAAVAATSVAFAALHWHYGAMLPHVLLVGAVLGWTRVASGGLRAPILLHALVNAAALILLLHRS